VEPAPDRIDLDVHPIDSFAFRANQKITSTVSIGVHTQMFFNNHPMRIVTPEKPLGEESIRDAWVTDTK